MARKKSSSEPKAIENRKARHDYLIGDTLEVGIALRGTEVKAIRDGKVSLAEGYVRVQADPPGLFLHGINISEYAPAGPMQHKPTRERQLLAHKREILKLIKETSIKGVTVVPLKMYFKDGWCKVLIGIGKGKTKGDKRQAIAERESKRDIDRAMSQRR